METAALPSLPAALHVPHAQDALTRLAHALARRLDAFAAARRERLALEVLAQLSDRDLRDIGLLRADLPAQDLPLWIGNHPATRF